MRYEPVGYIVEYEVSALVFLLVIMLRYFSARRFPNQKNRLFALILWVTVADLSLDVISSIIIDNVFSVPLAITYIVNAAFYALQIMLPILMTMYTMAMVEQLSWETVKRNILLLAPGAVILLMLLATSTPTGFSMWTRKGATSTESCLFLHICSAFSIYAPHWRLR